MNNENQHGKLVPDLRFPEFVGDWEWEEEKIGEKFSSYSGGTPSTSKKEYYGGTIPFIRSAEINKKETELFLTNEGLTSSSAKLVEKGDVLVALYGANSGDVAISKINGAINQAILCLKSEKSNPFLYHFFTFKKEQIISTYVQGGQGNLSGDIVKSIKLLIPELKEQQKIANCLSSLDNLIGAETEKLNTLKEHKKGLLQQLFPTDGETVPQLRFPEFKDVGNWIIKPLNEVYSFKITNSFSRDKLNYDKGMVKNIHYGDIHTKFSTLFDISKEIVPYINSDVSIDKIDQDNYCIEGDMVFADASEDLDDVGKSIELVNLNNEQLLSGLHTFLLRQIELKLITGFGGYLFKSNGIRTQVKKEAQGAKVLGISKGRISNINIFYPKKKDEQQKIANCLTSLDELITAETEKIESLKEHKKGLMQQLFPMSEP